MKRHWFGVLVVLLALAGACTHTGSRTVLDAAPAAPPTATRPGTPGSLSVVNTVGLLAFAADVGLMTLKGDGRQDSLNMQQLLESGAFPTIFQQSGRQYDLVWGPVANAITPVAEICTE